MDRWLTTPEDDPDSCSSRESLTDSASDENAEDSDEYDEPNYQREEFCRDTILPTYIEKVAMKVTETLQQPLISKLTTSAPIGSIGWLLSSADERKAKATTRRTRLRHPLHAETLSDICRQVNFQR